MKILIHERRLKRSGVTDGSCLYVVPLTEVSGGEVPAALTLPGLRVAVLAVAVALAWLAVREAPESRQAVGALATRGPRHTLALAGRLVAEGAHRALRVAVASWRRNQDCERQIQTWDLFVKFIIGDTHICSRTG